MLPQGYEGGGYYTYGTPDQGRSQYTHPRMITLIGLVAAAWSAIDERKFGVGNTSLADGVKHPDHATHRSGLEVNVRPLRKDGLRLPCTIHDAQYDREATAKLIDLFRKNGMLKIVLFNDLSIPHVTQAKGHNDHFHVQLFGAK
jgi:murein endopeptidase